ncbi:microvitellogenin-like [Ostrinia nubilalis]|uniref:microvitellogenin-like n=1 Tax=Ostrinia nubilalis TaxID=29057 RepID=UPI0030823E77
MSHVKLLQGNSLDKHRYLELQRSAKDLIYKISEFTKSSDFNEADNVLLEIKVDLLDMNFVKYVQCSDLLLCQYENTESIEDFYTEIKLKLKRKQILNSEKKLQTKSLERAIDVPKFDGSSGFSEFMAVFNDKVDKNTELSVSEKIDYLKSSLMGTALDQIQGIEMYAEMLQVLKYKFDKETNISGSLSRVQSQQESTMSSYSTTPAHIAYLNGTEITQELYKSIVQGSYSHAVKTTKYIIDNNHAAYITSVVEKLAQEGNRNLLSYVYQLWISGERRAVENHMPTVFKRIFDDNVTLVQKEYGQALKLGVNIDGDGDRTAWGDSKDVTSDRVQWKLLPVWENNQVFFKIKNIDYNMFLKLEIYEDQIGDRGAFGSSGDGTQRHIWILEPVVIDGFMFFYIINRQFSQGLKLQMSADSMGDRKLWGHNGNIHQDPSHYAWAIKP